MNRDKQELAARLRVPGLVAQESGIEAAAIVARKRREPCTKPPPTKPREYGLRDEIAQRSLAEPEIILEGIHHILRFAIHR